MASEVAIAKKRVQLIKNLPTLPGMIEQISRAVESKRFSAADIGKLISRDQVLTAKVLKLANSAFFGLSRKVGSLTQALVLLGFDVVKGLILTSSVFDLMKHRSVDLWKHSMAVATAASLLTAQLELEDGEEVSLAGLLHDLGKVVIRAHMAEDSEAIERLVESENITVRQAEQQVLGFTHSEVGQWLAESWKLPEQLSEPIRLHHHPARADKAPVVTAVVHFADVLARGYGYGDGGDPWVPSLDRTALKRLNLNQAKIEAVIDGMFETLVEGAPGMEEEG